MFYGGGGADHLVVRILHCDDSADYRALVRVLLERHPGLEVAVEAENGVEAVVATIATAPDVVVLDLDMPRGHGLDALPQLRRAAPGTPVYVLSGSTDPCARACAEAAGAAGWFSKGIDEDRLVDCLLAAT